MARLCQVSRPLLAKISVPKKGADARWGQIGRGDRWAKVCILLMNQAESLSMRDIIEISWVHVVQTYFQVHVPRVLLQNAWTWKIGIWGKIWPLRAFPPCRRRRWEPGRNHQEPYATKLHVAERNHSIILAICPQIPQLPHAISKQSTNSNPHLEESWQMLLPVVGLPSDLPGKDSSLESQLSILLCLSWYVMVTGRSQHRNICGCFTTDSGLQCGNFFWQIEWVWMEAMTQGTFWLLRELFNMVRCWTDPFNNCHILKCCMKHSTVNSSESQYHCKIINIHLTSATSATSESTTAHRWKWGAPSHPKASTRPAMVKRYWGPGSVDDEPPRAPPSKVVAWSWLCEANFDLE